MDERTETRVLSTQKHLGALEELTFPLSKGSTKIDEPVQLYQLDEISSNLDVNDDESEKSGDSLGQKLFLKSILNKYERQSYLFTN